MSGPWEKYSPPQDSPGAGTGPWTKYQSKNGGIDPSAAVQGFGNMATAGYLPEMTGAAGKMVPDPNAASDANLKAQGFKINQPDFNGATTDESRQMQAQMAKDSPYSYYGGGIGGAIASAPAFGAALKGAGIAKTIAPLASDAGLVAKSGNLLARAAQAGKEGAVLGAVSNPNTQAGDEGANIGRRIGNSVVGGIGSSLVPPAFDAVKGTLKTGASVVKWGASKLLSQLGVKPEVINEYANFSHRINAAPSVDALKEVSDDFVGKLASDVDAKKLTQDQAQAALNGLQSDMKDAYKTAGYDARDAVTSAQQSLKDAHGARIQQLSGDVYDTVKQLKSDVIEGSKKALNTLDKSESIVDLKPTYERVDAEIAKAKGAGTDESNGLAAKLQAWKDRQSGVHGDSAFGVDAKKLIKGLDEITAYDRNAGAFDSTKNAAFKNVRSSLDQTLKNTDSAYKAAMEPVAANSRLLESVQDFGDKQSAAGYLKNIEAPNQMERKAALGELGKKYGTDFVSASHPESLPEHQALNKALDIQESLRPDKVSNKIEQRIASSREQSELASAQSGLESSKNNLAPFKSLAPNRADQTTAQQKLAQLGSGKSIELTDMFRRLGKLTDTDFVQAMHDQNIQAAFKKGAYNGSRNAVRGGALGLSVGFLLGGTTGATVGAASGANLGALVDQWGPTITKKILDGALSVSKNPSVAAISKLDLPDAVKRNMAMGLKNYLAKEPSQLLPQLAQGQHEPNREPAKKLPGYADGGPVLNPDKVKAFTAAGGFPKPKPTPPPATSNYAFGGGPVPGHAKAQGNSSQNDTVHAMLSPGEIVLPRSVTQAKNAPEAAARFVAAHLKSHASGQTKGENKWAEQGLGKLGIQDRDLASKILQDPKSKRLLIQASDLAPNSKAMKQIMTQIQKGWAK